MWIARRVSNRTPDGSAQARSDDLRQCPAHGGKPEHYSDSGGETGRQRISVRGKAYPDDPGGNNEYRDEHGHLAYSGADGDGSEHGRLSDSGEDGRASGRLPDTELPRQQPAR
ncbi:hypothetical protein Areg01_80730 [Actinoplanes regularis]|nr:hypothetical protein Areg01_80730 [Actinoplanes regularis]